MASYTVKKNVPVRLTKDELLHAGQELSRYSSTLSDLENKKKEVNADFTAKGNSCKAEIEIQARMISTGVEYRDVECDVIIDVSQHKKFIVRTDTGEHVEEKKLTNEDLQTELNLAKRKEGG